VTVADPGGGGGGRLPYQRVIFGSGDFWCINVCNILTVWGTVSMFDECCYKMFSISRILTQNTLKCAISKEKFHFFLWRGTTLPRPYHRGDEISPLHTRPLSWPSATRHSDPPFQKFWIRHCWVTITVVQKVKFAIGEMANYAALYDAIKS